MKLKHTAALLALFVLAGSMTLPAAAQVRTVDPTAQFCFSQDDFTSAAADGIFLTSVPQETLATVRYGSFEPYFTREGGLVAGRPSASPPRR